MTKNKRPPPVGSCGRERFSRTGKSRGFQRLNRKVFPVRENPVLFNCSGRYLAPNGKMTAKLIDSPAALGRLIKSRRKELGLNQTELADVAHITLRLVSELERGKATAQLDGVLRVLAALGIALEARAR
jgi:y4mF family transcriptional regulator